MSKEYDSDSDLSDDDFCPEKEAEQAASASEEEEVESDFSEAECDEGDEIAKRNQKSRSIKLNKSECIEENKAIQTRNRSSRSNNNVSPQNAEKSDIPNEDDKEQTDALWKSFLDDVNKPDVTKTTENSTESNKTRIEADSGTEKRNEEPSTNGSLKTADNEQKAGKVETTAHQIKKRTGVLNATPPIPAKRSCFGSGSSGLSSVLGALGKQKKLSVLEKSKLDWSSFKKEEGIEEELQTHNKGKDGYLDRQDFLQRIDYRQFEIEKSMRNTRRTQ